MATTDTESTQPQNTVLTPEESREWFDRKPRARLGISGPEFIRRWDAGEFLPLTDTKETWDIEFVAALLPLGRR